LKRNTKRPPGADKESSLFDSTFFVASSTECTGLIPANPASESEMVSYEEIYSIPLSHEKKNK